MLRVQVPALNIQDCFDLFCFILLVYRPQFKKIFSMELSTSVYVTFANNVSLILFM